MYPTLDQDKFLAIFYTILTLFFNPIIYSFRNKNVLEALKNMLKPWNTCSLFPQSYLEDVCYSYLWKDNKELLPLQV